MSKNVMTLKSGSEVTQGHQNYTIQCGTHDLLLTFHSNYRLISHRFREKQRFPSNIARKSPIFPTPCVFNAPLKGFPLEFGIGARVPECFYDRPTRWSRKFSDRFSRFDTIPAVTDTQPPSQPRCRSKYALCIIAYLRRAVKTNIRTFDLSF